VSGVAVIVVVVVFRGNDEIAVGFCFCIDICSFCSVRFVVFVCCCAMWIRASVFVMCCGQA
jgi:hypothetical protein